MPIHKYERWENGKLVETYDYEVEEVPTLEERVLALELAVSALETINRGQL